MDYGVETIKRYTFAFAYSVIRFSLVAHDLRLRSFCKFGQQVASSQNGVVVT